MTELKEWGDFYVVVGSSAGALIGLQFVVLTLIAGRPVERGAAQASDAFTTPSVVHFAGVLLLSAVNSAPWGAVGTAALLWGLVGLGGIVYDAVVARRMMAQTAYRPVFEDWLFHTMLPFVAYLMLAVAAFAARSAERTSLFVVGTAALLLLLVGIHNAWDIVTHLVFTRTRSQNADASSDEEASAEKSEGS